MQIYTRIVCDYCPQMKFVKVMFSQVSVCPQGGSLSGRPNWSETPQDRDPLDRDLPLDRERPLPPDRDPSPGQRPQWAEIPHWTETPPWTETPLDRDPLDRDPLDRDPLPCMVTGGRYASYWNAFLFLIMKCIFPVNLLSAVDKVSLSKSGLSLKPFIQCE